jgi:hypothetical protein
MGFNSPSLNPENELPQWQQKIALRAENTPRPYHLFVAEWIFRTKCDFLQVLDLLIFRQIFEMQPCLHSKKGPHSWGRP